MLILPQIVFRNWKSLPFCRNLNLKNLKKSLPVILASANFRKINQN